ncbi:MAG: glutathione peroxidase [Rhizobiaceae bacterium]
MLKRKVLTLTTLAAMTAANAALADNSSSANAHSFSFETVEGERIELADFAGKAVLVVNTASQCNFTEQYGPLQALYEKYRDRGLVIVAVPSNDFGGQEPGGNAEIVEFAKSKFNVGFPITIKRRVKGEDADPFYRWANEQVGRLGKPRWNFHKYLIGPDGEMVTWFSSFTKPDSVKLAEAIEAVLPSNSVSSDG